MADPGCIPGLIGVGINILAEEILRSLKTAIYCHQELRSLEEENIEAIQGSASRPWRHQSSERRAPLMDAIPSKLQPCFGPRFIGQESMFNQVQSLIIADAEEDEDCCIGITGMGGAGKTALLQNVLNSHSVQNRFADHLIIWLTVSQNPSVISLQRILARSIAKQIRVALDDDWTDEEVQEFIYGTMKERRFLVILDDIWEGSEDLVEFLRVPRKRDSKIVFTTRDRRLLSRMGVRYKVTMKPLTQEEGWELFKIYAFRADRYIVTEEIEKIAKKIAGECRGLPLAIKVIGAALAGERDPEQWQVALEKLQNADTLCPQQEKDYFNA
eukprot:Gb_22369 [translate_table: standard]